MARLKRLWEVHRHTPFPGVPEADPHLQEIALYESWLGSIVDALLADRGRLSRTHGLMLEVRRREGNQALWAAAAEHGDAVRSYVARLLQIQSLLDGLIAA